MNQDKPAQDKPQKKKVKCDQCGRVFTARRAGRCGGCAANPKRRKKRN